MSFLTQWFGSKKSPQPTDEGEALLQELIHKVEQTFPESLKVAMRLIEKRQPAVDAAADYGRPGHAAFVELVLKAIHLRRSSLQGDAWSFTSAELPAAACTIETDVADLAALIERAKRQTEPLLYMRYVREWSEWSNVLLGIEAQLVFAGDPRTVLVFTSAEDFMASREWLIQAGQAIKRPIAICQVPEALACMLRRQEAIAEETGCLTDFGYPLTIFFKKE